MKVSSDSPVHEESVHSTRQLEGDLNRLKEYARKKGMELIDAYTAFRFYEGLRLKGEMTQGDVRIFGILKNWLSETKAEIEQHRQEYDSKFKLLFSQKGQTPRGERPSEEKKGEQSERPIKTVSPKPLSHIQGESQLAY